MGNNILNLRYLLEKESWLEHAGESKVEIGSRPDRTILRQQLLNLAYYNTLLTLGERDDEPHLLDR